MKIAKSVRAGINKLRRSKSSKKTILFVEQNQDGTVGGSYYSLFYLLKALDKKKYNALVIFYDKLDIVNKFTINDVTPIIYKKPTGKYINPPHSLLRKPYKLAQKCYNFITVSCIPVFKIAIFIVRNDVDLVHLNNSAYAGWQWLLVCKLLRRRCITHQRGFVTFSRLAKWRAQYFDTIICVSRAIERSLQNNNIFNTCLIYNAIDIEEFRSRVIKNPRFVREELEIKDSVPLIGLIANFQEWKGHFTVINAMDILIQRHEGVVCLLIGAVSTVKQDREYFIRVTKKIQNKGLEKNVVITGYRQDIPDLINSLDILIHSSIEPEPFGRVLIEGMCLGKAVIATDIGGPREIIKNGVSGILVPPSDPDALSDKIEYLLDHVDFRQEIGNEALKRVKEKFSLEKFSAEINLLYADYTAKSRSRPKAIT